MSVFWSKGFTAASTSEPGRGDADRAPERVWLGFSDERALYP